MASISHELRSPLHGILGTLEFLKDTNLDSFQTNMLNSLHSCGQTLLDTINQVMDYAKSNEAGKTVSSRRLKNSNTIRLSSKPLKTRRVKQVCSRSCNILVCANVLDFLAFLRFGIGYRRSRRSCVFGLSVHPCPQLQRACYNATHRSRVQYNLR